jgi:cation diffusion facilitator family transporter
MSAGGAGSKAIVAALGANLGIALSKAVAAGITGSSSMLAESVHSFVDTGNQGLLLLGRRGASQAPDTEHQFGYGRQRFISGFVVAIVLFSLGGLFAIYEGISKLRHPHELESPAVAIIVLLIAIGLESFSFRTAMHESAGLRTPGQSWFRFIRDTKNPELPVVLLEDLAALIGLLFAMAGVGLTLLTDNARWDGLGTLAIGLLLVAVAVILGIEMNGLLVGESATPAMQERIRHALSTTPGVNALIHLRTLHLGPEELLVGAKIEIDPTMTVPELAVTIDDAEARVRAVVPEARVMYIEPDIRRSASDLPLPESLPGQHTPHAP